MPKRYLVTGGSGFIGSNLVKSLVEDGNAVRIFDNNSRGVASRLTGLKKEVDFIQGDIRDKDSVIKALKDIDSVIHLAYVNGTEFFYSKPTTVLDIAIMGMMNVLEGCRLNNVREFVLASSSEVYQTPKTIPTDEKTSLTIPDIMNPRFSYGGGKIACELLAINYGKTEFERMIVFRPHNVYGKDMGWEHVIPQFILRAQDLINRNQSGIINFPILGNGMQKRAFCYIDDFIDGLKIVLSKGKHLNIYHIGNPEELQVLEVAEHIFSYLERKLKIVTSKGPEGETLRRCPDISKMRSLGFEPKVKFQDGLYETLKWYLKNIHLRPTN